MAGKSCLSLDLLLRDDNFKKLQEWFPKTDAEKLKNRIERFGNEGYVAEQDADDWYGKEEYRAAFTRFMHRNDRQAKIEKAQRSMKNGERLSNFNAILSVYSYSQLHDAINRVVTDFMSVLDYGKKNYKGINGARVVEKLGGFKAIMDKIFQDYESTTTESILKDIDDEGQMTDASSAEREEYAKRVALELHTMVKFKEHLIARAAGKISELSGVEANFDGLIADWKAAADVEVTDDDDSEEKRREGETKGASYIDVRFKRLSQTISAEAKRIISGIPMVDDAGEQISTEFGMSRTMDYAQVAYPLFRIIQTATPFNLMDKMKEAIPQYPWLQSLYDKINGPGYNKWKMRAVVYTNFKKAQNRYYTIYAGDGAYKTGLANSVAKSSSVIRHMYNNMVGGTSLGSKYSIYDPSGNIRTNVDYQGVQKELTTISNMLSGVEMREGKKPADAYGVSKGKREAYWGLTGEDSMNSFLAGHPEVLQKISDYARGIGLDVYQEDIERAAFVEMPKTKDFPSAKNRLSVLVDGINTIYGQAASGKYEDADTLLSFVSQASKKINFAIARALYDEVDNRVIVSGKAISATQNTNVVHQVTNILNNADNLDTDAYKNALMQSFGQYEGYSHHGKLIGWHGVLYEHPEYAKDVDVINLLSFNNVEYAKLSDGQRKLAPFIMWLENGRSVYELQIQADYEHSYEFVTFPGADGKGYMSSGEDSNDAQKELFGSTKVPLYYRDAEGNERWSEKAPIVDAFVNEMLAEIERIHSIQDRQQIDHKELSTYEREGKRFTIFPELNNTNFLAAYEAETSAVKREQMLRRAICEQLQKVVDRDIARYENSEISGNPLVKKMFSKGHLTATARADLQDFSVNSYYARIQTTRLYGGGFANFSSTIEFEKRSAFDHAPHSELYTEGMDQERNMLIIDDDETASSYIEQEKALFNKLYSEGLISKEQKDAYTAIYENINSTDGQGFVTLDSWVDTLKMLGEWNEEVQGPALRRIRNGEPKQGDIELIVADTHKLVGTGFQHIPAANLEGQKPIRNPFFHKYSEIPLLGPEFGRYTMQAETELTKGLSKAVEELKSKGIKIDGILFKSCSKLGTTGVLYPNAKENGARLYDTAEKISNYLVSEITANPEKYVNHYPITGYGKAASLPSFGQNDKITTASQAVKAAFADVEKGQLVDITVNGEQKDAVWARDEHDRIETAEIIDAYEKVDALITDKKELEKIFQVGLASKSYSSEETMYALSLLQNGEFAAHLFTPTFAKDVQNMLLSIISDRMTRKTSGGAHIAQYTSVGMDVTSVPWKDSTIDDKDLLGIEFEGEGEDARLVGIDASLPIYDSKLEIFADRNGAIPAALLRSLVESGKIQKEALLFEGYRTPSDHTHSVLPLIAKSLTAKVAGGRITMCKEAMKLTGHDYDGDEMNCHFPELELVWNDKKLHSVYLEAQRIADEKSILNKISEEEFLEKIKKNDGKNSVARELDRLGFDSKWRDAVSIKVVEYDFSKSPMEGSNTSDAARNNAKLTLRRSVLTSKDGAARLFIPGNNDETTKFAKTFEIMRGVGAETITQEKLQEAAEKVGAELNFNNVVSLYNSLWHLDIDTLNKLFDRLNSSESPFSLSYAFDAYRRVIGGASMIDVFALYSGAAQMLQRANLSYKERVSKDGYRMHVGFFGKRIGNLYKVKNNSGLLASLFMARMVQSAVDNNKNPILGMLNLGQNLAPMLNFLYAAGLSEEEILLVFNQPAIIELTNRLTRRDSEGIVKEAQKILWYIDDNYRESSTSSFNKKTYKALEELQNSPKEEYIVGSVYSFESLARADKDIKQLQCNLLRAFIHLNPAANDLTDIVRTTRPESSSATVGPTLSATTVKRSRLDTMRRRAEEGKLRIDGVLDLYPKVSGDISDKKGMYDELSAAPLKRVAAQNSLMYDQVMGWMQHYFPQARTSWVDLAVAIAKRYGYHSLQEGTIQQIFNDMLTWKILGNSSFLHDIEGRRKELLEGLPKTLRKIKDEVKTARGVIKNGGVPTNKMAASLVDNPFLNKLIPQNDRISFRPGGVVVDELRDQFVEGWSDLVNSEYDEIRKLATDLYEYNLVSNGMRFGMYEFAHLAPMSVLQAVPSLQNALDDVLTSDFTKGAAETKNFVRQYYMNHWQDDRLVPLYREQELPNGVRELFGLRTIDEQAYEHKSDIPQTVSPDEIKKKFYIAVKEVVAGKKKPDIGLFRVTVTPVKVDSASGEILAAEEISLQRVSKLGEKGKHGMMKIHYNPQISHRFFDLKDEVKKENYIPRQSEPDFGDDVESLYAARTAMADAADDAFAEELAAMRGSREAVRTPDAFEDDIAAIRGFRREAEKADEKNTELLESAPEEVIDYSEFNPELDVDEDSRGIELDNEDYAEEQEEVEETEEEQEEVPEESNSKKEFYIARKDGSDISVFKTPVRPWSIRQARKQRAYINLRKNIENILSQVGVSVGVLDEAEARMNNIYGVTDFTDFDKMKVVTGGMKELIRISEGVGGLVALPEEFGHLSVAMLGYNHPLVSRLLNAISDNPAAMREAFEGQYDEYREAYKDNEDKLAVEAAGKLIAKALLREQEIQTSPIRRIVQRVVDAIKELLRKIGLSRVERAEYDAEAVAGELARDLLSGRIVDQMLLENINETEKYYYKARKDISEWDDVVSKLLKIEEKRYKILEKRLAYHNNKASNASVVKTKDEIERLKEAIKQHKTEEAIISYFSYATDFLNSTSKTLAKITDGGYGANQACKKLDIIRDTIYGFRIAISNVNKAIEAGELVSTRNLTSSIKEISQYCEELMTAADNIGLQYFQGTLRKFYGEDGLEITIGRDKGKKISIAEMSTDAPKDISLFSRWVHSLGNCNDLVLKAIDSMVRTAKQTARSRTLDAKVVIDAAFSKLVRETGSRDQSFMFEKKRNKKTGKVELTGKYISAKDAEKLSLAQRDYYNTVMSIKKDIDKLLPESLVGDRKIVMMRKTAIEKAKESNDLKKKGQYLWEAAKNSVMELSDNIDFDNQEVEVGFNNNRVDRLPVLYTNIGKGETYEDMTDDVATSIMAYAAMANEYSELNNIIGELENAHYMAGKRRVQKNSGRRKQRETIGDDDLYFYEPYTVEQSRTNLQKVLDDFFVMHVYQHLRADEGTIGKTKISKGKAAQAINALTSISQLGFNLTQRIANLSVGEAQKLIQAGGNGLFTIKDLAWAAKEYMKNSADRLLETGKLSPDNYLSLFSEKFDIRQDNAREYKEHKYSKKGISRIFNTNLMYAGLTAGEDALACSTAMALARNFKVRNAEGKEDNLWNAYQRKYVDEKNKTGAYLELKKGWTNLDGSPITAEDERKFTSLCAGVNFDLQGIYNLDDKSAMQQYAFGSLVMMYRKWMAPALKLRYAGVHYDALRGQFEEGYYSTAARYLWDSISAIITEGEGIASSFQVNWEKLTPYEKTNIHKVIREFAILTGAVSSIFLLEKFPPDDKDSEKDKNWFSNMLIYQLYRLRNELGAMAPTPLLVQEGMKILQTPFASLSLLKNALEVWRLFLPSSYTTTVKSGAYKGHTKAYQYFWNMPVLSMRKQISHFVDPSPMINYYRNDVI